MTQIYNTNRLISDFNGVTFNKVHFFCKRQNGKLHNEK
uniref:Uncharacterized protein n=1 Tax=Anguilla anguilla TaxID=7936 RepID=A0A0E9U2M5_ANGAN